MILGIKSGKDVKLNTARLPQKKVISQTSKPAKPSMQFESAPRKIEKVKIKKNPFRDFYVQKYLARVEEEVKKKILKEIQEREKVERDRLLKELKRKLLSSSSTPKIDFRVQAIICSDKCYALTDKGVFKDGSTYKGRTLVITPSGVSIK